MDTALLHEEGRQSGQRRVDELFDATIHQPIPVRIAVAVAAVILGGIVRVGQVASRIVPAMVLLYLGDMIASGTPDEIRNSDNPIVQQFIKGEAEGPIPHRLSSRGFAEDLLGG